MAIYVDTNRNTYQVTRRAQPKVDTRTGEQKTDRVTKQLLSTVEVLQLSLNDEGGEVITVSLPGPQPEFTVGQQVTPIDLEALPWSQGDRSGVAYRAKALAPVTAGGKASHTPHTASAASAA